MSALVSNWAGPLVNIADFSRNATAARHPKVGYPIGMIVSYLLFAAVTVAFNVGATAFCVFGNLLPSGLQPTARLPRIFTVKTGGIVAAVLGTLIVPWKSVESTEILFLFYSFIGSAFGPLAGITLAHFSFVGLVIGFFGYLLPSPRRSNSCTSRTAARTARTSGPPGTRHLDPDRP